MGETRCSPTAKGGPTVKASGKRGSTRWWPSTVKQRKAAVCAATRSSSSLTDGSGSAMGEDGTLPRTANPASFSSSTPPTSVATDWGRGNPNRLGFEPQGRGSAYKGVVGGMNGVIDYSTRGGHPRWRTRPHDLPFPWRWLCVRAEEEERGKGRGKGGGDVETDERGPRVSDSRSRLRWRATWQRAGWAALGPKVAAGRLGWLAAQEGMKRVFLLSLFLLNI
jgi:hypothetical protein